MKLIQRRVFVSGRVQGVGFRRSTEIEAGRFPQVRGYVRNTDDGRVEAVFCGPEPDVLALAAWCGRGPFLAKVTQLQVIEEDLDTELVSFEVR